MLTTEQKQSIDKYSEITNRYWKLRQCLEEREARELSNVSEDYLNYCNHYRAYYNDSPLTIHGYFVAMNRWRELMDQHNAIYAKLDRHDPNCDYSEADKFESETKEEFANLERILAA